MYTMTVKALEGALRNMEMYHAKDCACNECKNIREALAAERATPMRKPFKFNPDKRDPDDPTTTRTNGQRAIDAEEAVQVACRSRGETGTPDEDSVRDLLVDLGHLCDREGLIETAKRDWRAER